MCSPGAGCVETERSLCAAGRMEGVGTGEDDGVKRMKAKRGV